MTLPLFEDQPVTRAAVKIMKAGDGLSDALKIEPRPMHLDTSVYFVLRGVVTSVQHVQKDDVLTRVHVVTTEHITEVDANHVDALLDAAADRRERARAHAVGQTSIDDDSEGGGDE